MPKKSSSNTRVSARRSSPRSLAGSRDGSRARREKRLPKTPSGVDGLDEVTLGGLPRGRPTLVCGGAGCGKSLFAMEFLVRGASEHGEPGVFVSFEEPIEDLVENVKSLGFDLPRLVAQKKVLLDYVHVERNEIEEAGEYDLEALFIRLEHAIDAIGAKRIVLDTIEALFAGLSNEALLRSELRRLFHWLKERGVTAVITGERGDGSLTRRGLEEYVSDCVILLDHRVVDQVATRRLRIVKYRGSVHGTNEYPFLIDEGGITVLPLTSLGLDHPASKQRVSTGVEGLDEMLGGLGFFRGSSVLVTGTAGTGKSTLAASFVAAACARGERAMYFAFEESRAQMLRNMSSVGIDLAPWVEKKRALIHATRPTYFGLEMHLATMHKAMREFAPDVVVVDPISSLIASGTVDETKSMLLRLVDFMKSNGVTSVFTSLTHHAAGDTDDSELGVSSLMDTWILLRDIELAGERNRGVNVVKSRGMTHSNQVREFTITRNGIAVRDAYLGHTGILTGSARMAEEARTEADEMRRRAELQRLRIDSERKRKGLQAQIEVLRAEYEAEAELAAHALVSESERADRASTDSRAFAARRGQRTDTATPIVRRTRRTS